MMTVGERVRRARKAARMTQTKLGQLVGISSQAIQQLEAGDNRTSRHLITIARILKTPPEWLESGHGSMRDQGRDWSGSPAIIAEKDQLIEVDGTEFARLPVYDIRFAAGDGAINDNESPIDHYLISMSLLRSMSDAAIDMIGVFQVKGDSMEPTLNNHDWVMVDRRRTKLGNPGIYALVFEGEGLLKRVSRHLETGTVTLISDNPKYEPQIIKKPERLSVVGRVILSIRRH
jgi:phage repressor protein C with HTH and peptisase S24 domain